MNEPMVYKNYFEKYTALVPEKDILSSLLKQSKILHDFFGTVSEEKADYSYAAGKWTLKEMLQHLIDTERIFGFRALSIARKETVTLNGFDENSYAANSSANKRTWAELVNEMKIVRESTTLLFRSFTEEMLNTVGNFSAATATVNTIGSIIVGHFYHHLNIANERYLN